MTRGDTKKVLKHLIENILEIEDDDPLALALEQNAVTKITQLLSLDQEDIGNFTYHLPGKEEEFALRPAHYKTLFQAVKYYRSLPGPRLLDEWFALNSTTFSEWLANPKFYATKPDQTSSAATSPTVTTVGSELLDFARQIRRTPSDFTEFKKESEWSTWKRSVLATATAQDVQLSYDLDYVPTTAELPKFEAIQKYNYSVLVKIVQTTFGRGAVRRFESTYDAQGVYRLLFNHYGKGVHADIQAQSLEEEILGMRLDDKHRKGCENFLNVWDLKVQELDSIRVSIVPDQQKRIWLTSSLQAHPKMSAAITQASTMEHTMAGLNNKALTLLAFPQFFDLCITTAKHIDRSNLVATKQQREANAATRGQNDQDDKWYVPNEEWNMMTKDQKKQHWKKKKEEAEKRLIKAQAALATLQGQVTPLPEPPTPPVVVAPPPQTLSLRETLANAAQRSGTTGPDITIEGKTYRQVSHTNIKYKVQSYEQTPASNGSLLDGGSNGGILGEDARVIKLTEARADVYAVGDNTLNDLSIGTGAGLVQTESGPIIAILHQYAIFEKGKTIHSTNQLRAFGLDVNDIPKKFFGKQRIVTPEGYIIPLKIKNGLAFMDMSPPTDAEMETYPHVLFTSAMTWDPTTLDDENENDPLLPNLQAYAKISSKNGEHNPVLIPTNYARELVIDSSKLMLPKLEHEEFFGQKFHYVRGTLGWGAKTYVKNLLVTSENMFSFHLKEESSLLDHVKKRIGPVIFWKGNTKDFPAPKLRGVTDANSLC
jgi:hypothetical protein